MNVSKSFPCLIGWDWKIINENLLLFSASQFCHSCKVMSMISSCSCSHTISSWLNYPTSKVMSRASKFHMHIYIIPIISSKCAFIWHTQIFYITCKVKVNEYHYYIIKHNFTSRIKVKLVTFCIFSKCQMKKGNLRYFHIFQIYIMCTDIFTLS